MKYRRLIFFVFIIFLNFIFITTVKADSWTDEGNYNPNWQEKCVNVCFFDDEKDLAGVLKSIKSGYHPGVLEYDFTKDTLDFRAHTWESLPRNFSAVLYVNEIILNGGDIFSQGGQITNRPSTNDSLIIKYECDIRVTNHSHATAAIDKSIAFTDEIVTVLVTPEEGYHLEGVTATNAKKVTKITNNLYEITVGNYDINIIPNVVRDNHSISFIGDGGYSVNGNTHYYYGDTIDISLTPELGINIDQVLINGENYQLLNGNRIYLENVTDDIELNVITSRYPLTSLHKEGSINLYHTLKKVDNQNTILEGARFKFYDHNNTLSIDFNEDKQYKGIHTFSYDNGVILYNGLTFELNDLSNQELNKEELYDMIYNMLPDYYKNLLKFTTTYDDFVTEIDNNPNRFLRYSYNNYLDNEIIYFDISLPMIIEETKSPGGYIKEKYVVIENVFVVLEFYEDTNLERVSLNLSSKGVASPVYKYDESFFTSPIGPVINKTSLGLECFDMGMMSNKNDGYKIIPLELEQSHDLCTIIVVNELGSYKLAIDSTIDDKKSVEVPYKSSKKNLIRVTNTGEASVSDAILRVDVPKNLKVIEGSISDGGLYNSTDNAIIWQIDYVDIDNPVTLSFDFTPLNNSGKDIVIPATLKKNGEELTSEVDVTVVSEIPVKNTEKDGNIISLVIVLLTLLITGLCAYKLDKKNKALKKE